MRYFPVAMMPVLAGVQQVFEGHVRMRLTLYIPHLLNPNWVKVAIGDIFYLAGIPGQGVHIMNSVLLNFFRIGVNG